MNILPLRGAAELSGHSGEKSGDALCSSPTLNQIPSGQGLEMAEAPSVTLIAR